MGNQGIHCGYCTREVEQAAGPLLCGRGCGLEELEPGSCDPAGCVFDETLRGVGHLEQMAFRFAASSNLAALRWLFVFGACADVCDSNGTTLLHVACRTGSMPVVQDLVRRGSSLNAADCAGWTPLHVASCIGRQDVSLYLLQWGAKPHKKNLQGQAPEDLCSHPWTKEVVIGYDARDGAKPSKMGFPRLAGAAGEGAGRADRGTVDSHPSLHFEPFFVPRDPVFCEPQHREEVQHVGVALFNRSPGHGLAFLVAMGAVRDYPVEINNFLLRIGADPARFGEYLGEDFPIAQTLRLEFLNSLPLLGTGVVSALRVALHEVAMPRDWQKADRLTRGIAHFWWRQHEEELADRKSEGKPPDLQGIGARGELAGVELQRSLLGTDGLHRLMFSAWMLHRWLSAGHQMSLNEWVQLNTGIEGSGCDVPIHVQTGIYKAMVASGSPFGDQRPKHEPMLLPTMQSWAGVHYYGRPQVSHAGDLAAWPDASPRTLAAQGGASSAGRTAPLPGGPEREDEEVEQRVELGGSCTGSAGKRRVCALSALAAPAAVPGLGRGGDVEAAWVSLQHRLLFLAHSPQDAPPYAVVSLDRVALREVDSAGRRLVLASRAEASWPPAATTSEDEWLDLCLLLGDGRFQSLEAPQLELQLASSADFDAWVAHLGELCFEGAPLRVLPSNGADVLGHSNSGASWSDEPLVLQVPDMRV